MEERINTPKTLPGMFYEAIKLWLGQMKAVGSTYRLYINRSVTHALAYQAALWITDKTSYHQMRSCKVLHQCFTGTHANFESVHEIRRRNCKENSECFLVCFVTTELIKNKAHTCQITDVTFTCSNATQCLLALIPGNVTD